MFAIALDVTACASTTMSSMPAPELQGRVFHTILVIAAFDEIGLLRATEDRFATQNVAERVRFVPSYQLFFPGRQYSPEQSAGLLRQYQVEAVLVVSVRQAGANNYYVPPTYTTGCTAWNPVYGCAQTTTTQTGGGSYQKPWAQFSAQLYDATSGAPVWIATATTGGNALATDITLVQSMADKTVSRLFQDRVINWCLDRREANSVLARVWVYIDSVRLLKSSNSDRKTVDSLISALEARIATDQEALRRCPLKM
jgi:hypothetical protein